MNTQHNKLLGIAGAAALAALAVPALAGQQLNAMDQQFTTKVAQGNIAEVRASRLALKKSSNPKVRMIATMLITDHGQAQVDLTKVGKQVGTNVPQDTDPKHKALYSKLSGLSGTAFDKAYMTAQVRDHYSTIALFQKEMANGSQTSVHSFAQQYLPGIQNHTDMITKVASGLGIQVAAASGGSKKMSGMGTGKAASSSMPPMANPSAPTNDPKPGPTP